MSRKDALVNAKPATVRRLMPRDRRAPVDITRGSCPAADGCLCCPNATQRWHRNSNRTCDQRHPPDDRKCSPPYPANISACPERPERAAPGQEGLTQDPPPAPDGFRPPHYSCCVECGRITARRWTDTNGRRLPWCAGTFPDPEPRRT